MLGRGVGLIVGISGDTSGLSSALGDAGKQVKGFGGISLATAAKVTLAGGAIVLAADALGDMAKAADADRAEQAGLIKAIEQAGAATGDYTTIVDEAITAGQNRAFSDSETRAGLQSLVTATQDVGIATQLLTGAQDIARLSGVSLEQASDALAKAYAGNDGALRKLVPGLAKGATAQDTIAAATARAAGQADIFAASGEGMGLRVTDALGELGEEVGGALLPAFDSLMPALLPIIAAFGRIIKAILPILIPLVELLAKAFGFVADAIANVAGFISDLIGWFSRLIKPISDAIDWLSKLNPFSGLIDFVTGRTGGGMSGATGGPSGTMNATFNIYGDPATIERTVVGALRDFTRRNGYVAIGLENR